MSIKGSKSIKGSIHQVDLPLPPVSTAKGYDERKSSSPNSHESKIKDDNDNDHDDDNVNIVSKVMELVSPFITDYIYDINDIKLPKKLLYEGRQFNTITSLS
jgi:hypothetical protein